MYEIGAQRQGMSSTVLTKNNLYGEEDNMKIKGIMHLDADSQLFQEKVYKNKEESLGVNLSMEWELDRISLSVDDKSGNAIGTLVFDNTDFQGIAQAVMPPELEDLPDKEPTEEVKKEIEKEAKEIHKHPVKKEIEELHK